MNRKVKDFLKDDNFIFSVFEGLGLDELVKKFGVNTAEMKQCVEAINVLEAPSDVCCGISDDEVYEVKSNCISVLFGK